MADEPEGPEDPKHPDDFDEAEVAIWLGNVHQGESHYYEVQLRPAVTQVSVAFQYQPLSYYLYRTFQYEKTRYYVVQNFHEVVAVVRTDHQAH